MRGRAGAALAATFLALVAAPLLAQEPAEPEPRPFARTRLEPGDRVTVGQPVTIVVEVLVPSFFTGAPRFPDLDVDDSIALFEDRGRNFTERIDAITWAGQGRRYHVYPQRPGEFEIAEIPVTMRYRSESARSRTEAIVSPPPVRFSAVLPPGAEELPYFISTTGLEMAQDFDREPATLEVGEAFVRTITVTVTDALSMVVPPFTLESPVGLAAYADPAEVTDEGGERSERVIGTRVERTTYVAEKAGNYRLAPVELTWWDVGAQRMRTTTLAALEIRVEPSPDLVAAIPLPPEEPGVDQEEAPARQRVSPIDLARRWGPSLAAAALLSYLLVRLWRRLAPSLWGQIAEARRRRSESEAANFASFRRAALSGDLRATWNRWAAWLDHVHHGPGAATARAFVEAAADPELDQQAAALEALLFAGDEGAGRDWSGRTFYRSVARARRRVKPGAESRLELSASLNPRTTRRTS